MRYAIVIENAGCNFSAYVPDLPGCVATGESLAEVERSIREAIQCHPEGMREDGSPIPRPPAKSTTWRSPPNYALERVPVTTFIGRLKTRSRVLLREVRVLSLAVRHPRTPWYSKALIGAVVAYALSPVDLIPDFVPVLGLLDDLLLVPGGIYVATRLTPPDVMAECRTRVQDTEASRPRASPLAAVTVVVVWLVLIATGLLWLFNS